MTQDVTEGRGAVARETRDGRRVWGWWFYDWASQPYATLLLTFIFSIYFAEVARTSFMADGLTADAAGARAQCGRRSAAIRGACAERTCLQPCRQCYRAGVL